MMHRRTFCIHSSATLAAALLPIAGFSQVGPALQAHLSMPSTLATLSDTDTIVELGNADLAQARDENTPARLIDALLINSAGRAIPASTNSASLQRLMAEKVQSNFKTGETVVVNGWVLSRTEARQCALFSLTQEGP